MNADLAASAALKAAPVNSNMWLLSFADLAANMLAFFVLQFTMLEVDLSRLHQVTQVFAPPHAVPALAAPALKAPASVRVVVQRAGLSLDYLAAVLAAELKEDGTLSGAALRHEDERLVLALPGALLFAPGETVLTEAAARPLASLAGLLQRVPNQVAVVGHTGPEAVASNGGIASNWDLSVARAATVAAALREAGYGRNLDIMGRAGGAFAGFAPELPAEQRRLAAERVELVIGTERGR